MEEHEQVENFEERVRLDRAGLIKAGGLGALALGGLGALGGGVAMAAPTASNQASLYAGLKGKTVGLAGVAVTSEAPARAAKAAQALGRAFGFKVEVVDTNGDYAKMSQTLVTWSQSKKVQAIISDVVAPSLIRQGMKAAADAKIPVGGIFAGYEPPLAFDVASNEWISTARIGTYMVDRLGNKGQVAFLNWPNVPALQIRQKAIEAILGYYPGIKVVSKQVLQVPGQVPDAKAKTRALLQKYPKGKLQAIWAGWDEVGVAASQACKEAGRNEVFVVSIDGNLNSFDAIRKGEPFAATCANDMENIAAVCLQQLSAMLQGKKPIATSIWVDAPFVAKQNLPAPGRYPKGDGLTPFYVA